MRVCICIKLHTVISICHYPSIRPSIHPSIHNIASYQVTIRLNAPLKMICKSEVEQTLQSRAIHFTEYWWVPIFRETFKFLMKVDDAGSATFCIINCWSFVAQVNKWLMVSSLKHICQLVLSAQIRWKIKRISRTWQGSPNGGNR